MIGPVLDWTSIIAERTVGDQVARIVALADADNIAMIFLDGRDILQTLSAPRAGLGVLLEVLIGAPERLCGPMQPAGPSMLLIEQRDLPGLGSQLRAIAVTASGSSDLLAVSFHTGVAGPDAFELSEGPTDLNEIAVLAQDLPELAMLARDARAELERWLVPDAELPRVCQRPFCLDYATKAISSNWAS